MPLYRETAQPVATELLGHGLVEGLRQTGVTVDQRTLVLRPEWRGDDGVLRLLGQRPGGPADVALVEFTDPMRAAGVHGNRSPAFASALAAADSRTEALIAQLGNPSTWLLTFGGLQPVQSTFDAVAGLRRALPRNLRHRVRCHGNAQALRITCDDWAAALEVTEVLGRAPFNRSGSVITCDDPGLGLGLLAGELVYAAAPGWAFGSQPCRARMPLLPARTAYGAGAPADGAAVVPPGNSPGVSRTLRSVAMRLLMVAAEMGELKHRDGSELVPLTDPDLAPSPDGSPGSTLEQPKTADRPQP